MKFTEKGLFAFALLGATVACALLGELGWGIFFAILLVLVIA